MVETISSVLVCFSVPTIIETIGIVPALILSASPAHTFCSWLFLCVNCSPTSFSSILFGSKHPWRSHVVEHSIHHDIHTGCTASSHHIHKVQVGTTTTFQAVWHWLISGDPWVAKDMFDWRRNLDCCESSRSKVALTFPSNVCPGPLEKVCCNQIRSCHVTKAGEQVEAAFGGAFCTSCTFHQGVFGATRSNLTSSNFPIKKGVSSNCVHPLHTIVQTCGILAESVWPIVPAKHSWGFVGLVNNHSAIDRLMGFYTPGITSHWHLILEKEKCQR